MSNNAGIVESNSRKNTMSNKTKVSPKDGKAVKPTRTTFIKAEYDHDGCINMQIAPGIWWQSEIARGSQEAGSRLLDERGDGTRTVVRLNDRFHPQKVEEYFNGKAYRVSGEIDGKSGEFTLLNGQNGLLYAVGKNVKTYGRGRVNPFHQSELPYLREKSRSAGD